MNRTVHLAVMLLVAVLMSLGGRAFAQDVDYQQSLAQSKIFMKQERYRDAVQELRKALSTQQGDRSFEAHFLYAQAAYKTFDIAQAVEFARLASDLTTDPKEMAQAQDLYNYLTLAFGKIEFVPGPGELKEGYLVIQSLDPILDPDIASYYQEKVAPLAEQRRSLPWLMWLPTLALTVNGKEFSVIPGGEITQVEAGITAASNEAQDKAIAARRAVQEAERRRQTSFFGVREGAPAGLVAEARLGYAALQGQSSGSQMGPAGDLYVSKEFGRLGIGAFGTAARNHVEFPNYRNGVAADADTRMDLAAGALVSLRIWLPGRLSLRPAVGGGLGTVNGAIYYCDVSTADYSASTNTVTYTDCVTEAPTSGSDSGQDPRALHLESLGFGPAGRLDLLYERETGFGYLGGTFGLHTLALSSRVSTRPSSGGEFTEEVVLADVSRTLLTRVGVVVGLNLAF